MRTEPDWVTFTLTTGAVNVIALMLPEMSSQMSFTVGFCTSRLHLSEDPDWTILCGDSLDQAIFSDHIYPCWLPAAIVLRIPRWSLLPTGARIS